MRAIALQSGFGISQLEVIEREICVPSDDEVLVKLEAVSLNYVDLLVIKGLLDPDLALPYIPITDGAGVVEQVGKNVTNFAPGDSVITTFIPLWLDDAPTEAKTSYSTRQGLGIIPGQLSEKKVFATHQLVHRPVNLSSIEAATLPIAGLTAWNALHYGGLQAEDTILLHGTGGVSIFALQFAKAQGARVIITSSRDDKLKRAKQLGADFAINYRTEPNWESSVRRLTNDQGADMVVETVGGQNLARSLSAVKMGGYISVVGLLDGFESSLNILDFIHSQVTIRGMEVGSTQHFIEMNKFIQDKDIHPVVDRVFSFDETKAALEYLEQGKHFGKVVIGF